MKSFFLVLCLLSQAAFAGSKVPPQVNMVRHYDCQKETSCQELTISNDPLSVETPYFRGYADPSVEYDPQTGALWMTYSWLHNGATNGTLVGLVETHLAKSTDGGHSFNMVRVLKNNQVVTSPSKGWINHEVSSITSPVFAGGPWQIMWLSYHKSLGGVAYQGGSTFEVTPSKSPADTAKTYPWFSGPQSLLGGMNLSKEIPSLARCTGYTEPALLTYKSSVFLGVNCVVIKQGRDPTKEAFVLLKQTNEGLKHIADVLTYEDAQALGGQRIEQVDLFETTDGSVGMLATVMTDHEHKGCHFIKFLNFEKGLIEREQRTKAAPGKPRATIIFTDSKSQPIGHGACTYDAKMGAGVLMVRRVMPPYERGGVSFTIMKTGVKL